MSEFSNVKTFGGVGALLSLIGTFIPYAGPILSLLGLILVFIAVKKVSDLTKDDDIFKNYLYNFIMSIIAIVAIFVIVLIGFGAVGGFSWIASLQDINITDFSTFWDYFGGIIGYAIMALFVGWVLAVIGSIFLRRSYIGIAKHTNVNLFKTTGTVYLIGAVTMIVLVGFLLIFIARIMEIIAYFSLPDELPGKFDMKKTGRKCPHCDKDIPEDAVVCPYCGKNF